MNKNKLLYLLILLLILPCMVGCNNDYTTINSDYERLYYKYPIRLEEDSYPQVAQKHCYTYYHYSGMKETGNLILYYNYDTSMDLCFLDYMMISFLKGKIKVSVIDIGGKTQSNIEEMTFQILDDCREKDSSNPVYIAGIPSPRMNSGSKESKKLIKKYPNKFDGLILYGDTLSKKYDFSDMDIKVFCMYGSNDNIVTPQDIEDSKIYYPSYSKFFEIEGANHTNMHFQKESRIKDDEHYNEFISVPGPLDNKDFEATISLSEQIDSLSNETINFLYKVGIEEGTNND